MASDFLNELTGTSINIYGSREKIRAELIDNAKKYLKLEGIGENIYKTSLLAYIIDTLSILSANQLFYDTAIYREFFMVDAQMQESVYNLARWIGYKVPKAIPAKVNLIFQIPLTFESNNISFVIPKNFVAKSGDIEFRIDSNSLTNAAATFNFNRSTFNSTINTTSSDVTKGQVVNNTALTVIDGDGYMRPIYYYKSSEGKLTAAFSLPFKQQKRTVVQFLVPADVQQYQFFNKEVSFDGMISDIRVWVIEASTNEKITLDTSNPDDFSAADSVSSTKGARTWTEWFEAPHGIYTMAADSQQFIFTGGDGQGEVFFGNGIVGKQLPPNSAVAIEIFSTRGTDAYVLPNTITNGSRIEYTLYKNSNNKTSTSSSSISYKIYNAVSPSGATDLLTLPEVKEHAIVNLRTKGKLVSEGDYDDINIVCGDQFPTVEAFPILKRSDIKTNEILAFTQLLYSDEYSLPQIVPTRNIKVNILDDGNLFNENGQYTLMRSSRFTVDNNKYQTIFNITMDKPRMVALYDYVAKDIFGTTAELYNNNISCFYNQYTYAPISGVDFNIDLESQIDKTASQVIIDGSSKYPLNIVVHINHIPSSSTVEDNKTKIRCRMITKWGNNQEYQQQEDVNSYDYNETVSKLTFKIDNYLEVPSDLQRFEFYIDVLGIKRDISGNYLDEDGNILRADENGEIHGIEAWMPLKAYYTDVTIRKNLNEVMLSEMTKESVVEDDIVMTNYTIHNVPAILSDYVENVEKKSQETRETNAVESFEISVLQALVNNLEISDKRMLTDFINIKFPDTYGTLNNLKYNPCDYVVQSISDTPFSWKDPLTNKSGDTQYKYIVNGVVPGYEKKQISEYINYIAEWYNISVDDPATLEVNIVNRGIIKNINVLSKGFGYTEDDIVVVSDPERNPELHTDATFKLNIGADGCIKSVDVLNGGTGYTNQARVSIASVGGQYAEITADIKNGEIISVVPTPGGAGSRYSTTLSHIKFETNGSGTGAVAIIKKVNSITGAIEEIEVVNGGEGYVDGETTAIAYSGVWYLRKPERGTYVKVLDEIGNDGYPEVYIYNGTNWINSQSFTIPLKITLKVEMDPLVTISSAQLADNIKYELMYHFNPLMGIQKNIDRSEIITVTRAITGVKYCELLEPAVDIRFKYDIKQLEQKQLIDYTPQYVGFTNDDIEIIFM